MKMRKKTKIALVLMIVFTVALMVTLAFSFATIVTSAENIELKSTPTPEYKNTGKCINCERQLGINTRWKGESNKCYDCERDMIIRSGGDLDAAYGATKVKCFDC